MQVPVVFHMWVELVYWKVFKPLQQRLYKVIDVRAYRPYMRYATVSQVQAHGSMHMNDIIHEINTVKIGHADLCLVTIKSLRCRKFEPFIIKDLNFVALILHPSCHTSHVSFLPVFHKQTLASNFHIAVGDVCLPNSSISWWGNRWCWCQSWWYGNLSEPANIRITTS